MKILQPSLFFNISYLILLIVLSICHKLCFHQYIDLKNKSRTQSHNQHNKNSRELYVYFSFTQYDFFIIFDVFNIDRVITLTIEFDIMYTKKN